MRITNFSTFHAMGMQAPWRVFRVVDSTESTPGVIVYQGTSRYDAAKAYLALENASLTEYLRDQERTSPIGYRHWRTEHMVDGIHSCSACPGARVQGQGTCDDGLRDYVEACEERQRDEKRLVLSVHKTEEV